MTFYEVLEQALALLQRHKRISYRALKLQFYLLGDDYLEALKDELIYQRVAEDEDGKGLVWTGEVRPLTPPTVDVPSPSAPAVLPQSPGVTEAGVLPHGTVTPAEVTSIDASKGEPLHLAEPSRSTPEGERRQLTVMFCDLVGSTDLSGKLDPEDLREVVRAYQSTAAEVIQRYEGYIAQYLGDGLLIYFGFPVAHEDDAQRAVLAGVGIVESMGALNIHLEADYGIQLAVRIGIHTGPVVVGEMGGGGRHENLALGATPNVAARLEGLAEPNTVLISPVTAQLVRRTFVLKDLGPHQLKGVAEPMRLHAVVGSREMNQDNHEARWAGGFDVLVGRSEEIGLLRRRWEQSKEGLGQVVLLSGEAGIGKSSLVEGLRAHVRQEGHSRLLFRCSPYHASSTLYPIIDNMQRTLGWRPDDPASTKLAKLEHALEGTSLARHEAVPIMASLLSLELPEDHYPILTLSPQQLRQQTQETLVAWLQEEAERQAILAVWEDLHWADPSTLEVLGLVLEQAPTSPMLHVLTYRPEFDLPWSTRSHMTPMSLNRLERPQVEALINRLAGDKALPVEVVEHIVMKTDGVPLYVEEMTKMLVDSDLLREEAHQYVLTGPLGTVAIPDTLQDSLMARLDQLQTAKEVAQLGAVLGREFPYEMLQAICSQDDETLQSGLAQLVAAELLYQRGRPPQAKYSFKHALIQDAAYQSLLRSTRQRVHQQTAQWLEVRVPETVEAQPELVAHHYTEGGCLEPALAYWQQAGLRAQQRSANHEAIRHLKEGLKLIAALPTTPERAQQELDIQMTLGSVLMATTQAAPEVEHVYTRARELCGQLGETSQLLQVLWGLWRFYVTRLDVQMARELGDELLAQAQVQSDPIQIALAHQALGGTLFTLGEFRSAREHLEESLTAAAPAQYGDESAHYIYDPNVQCLAFLSTTLWFLGYPDQALRQSQAAHTLAQKLAHPPSEALYLFYAFTLRQRRREAHAADTLAEALLTLSMEHGFTTRTAMATFMRGWVLAEQGQRETGVVQMRQGLSDTLATGSKAFEIYAHVLLAEVYGKLGQTATALAMLDEALVIVEETGDRRDVAEVYRLKGELLLQPAHADVFQAEASFHEALDIARQQQAKSWELRAATSLAHLWQFQGKHQDAYDLLAPVYEWFTEGFDTADLVEANVLLETLRE